MLNGKSEYEVLSLRVNPLNIEDIKDTVVNESRKLGLSVLFEEEKSAYLGNGVDFEGSFEYENKYFATVPNVIYCCMMFYERIKPILLENGFIADDSSLSYSKEIPNGKIGIEVIRYTNTDWYTEFLLDIYVELKDISNILNSLYNVEEYDKKIYISWKGLMRDENQYFIGDYNSYQCKSYDSIIDITEHLKIKLKDTIFPFFNECSSMENLAKYQHFEEAVDRSGLYFIAPKYINLLIAYFGKNPDFERFHNMYSKEVAQKLNSGQRYLNDVLTFKVIEYIFATFINNR